MARARSPDREKAFDLWIKSAGSLKLKDIAEKIGVSDQQIRKWKSQDKWDQKLNSSVTKPKSNVNKSKGNVTKKVGAPKGNKNALGHKDGGGPAGNRKALKHGFFAKIFPDDPETKEIFETIDVMSPVELLWQNIVIQYTAIARAQRIMFVQDREDMTKELKRQKESDGDSSSSWEKEYELQFAWDKQANFMQAQSRAMSTLQGMISKYDELMQKDMATEEQQLRINKLKAEIAKLTDEDDNNDDSSNNYIEALKGKVAEVWPSEK